MAYTQAYPLDQTVQDAFDLKVKLLEARAKGGQGAEEATYYFNARTPWIKMTSCVNLVGQSLRDKFRVGTTNELAKKYILGTTKPGDAFAGHNYDRAYGEDDKSYGIRPQPGITNMDIVSYNKYGSLRKATINFQVWTKEDLDACEILYMRPGMSVLLEWGWSLWVSGEGSGEDPFRVNDMGAGIDVLTPKVHTLHQALNAIERKQKEYNYGYDGILGFVKNFKWSIRPDGGYDCSTELITAGELVESINMAKPLADDDVKIYSYLIGELNNELVGKAKEAATKSATYTPIVGSTSSPGFYSPAEFDTSNKLYQELMGIVKDTPSPETQTVLSAFINFDLYKFADSVLQEQYKFDKSFTVQYLDLKDLAETSEYKKTVRATSERAAFETYLPITTRLVEKRGSREVKGDILRINWLNPEYATQDGGDKGEVTVLTDDGEEFAVIAKHEPKLYIRYGLILEIFNNFMLQQGDNVVTPFDVDSVSRFKVYPNLTISIDPSICLLPADESILRQGVDPDTLPSTLEFDENAIVPNIYDIRISVELLVDLLAETGLSRVSQEGTPFLRLFDMVQTLNTKINESTGGLLNLDMQYYEHLGIFSIIDRKTFSSAKKYYQLNLFGLKSLMHSISVTSALTPDMSSQLAISAQTKITNADSHSAGFLRFNEGIQDRVIKDRSLDGVVVKDKNKEYANTKQEDFSEIFNLYRIIYGQFMWAEVSFPHAKNKFVELVKTLTGNTETGTVGQVVIPFVSNLVIDGMSGFRILNGFTLPSSVLPYKYGIRGGVGQVLTGLQATVDSTTWKTSLKSQFYNLEAGTIKYEGLTSARNSAEDQSDLRDNYVYKYARELSKLDRSNYTSYQASYDSNNAIIGSYGSEVDSMRNLIIHHFEDYWKSGKLTEIEDASKLVKVGNNFIIANDFKDLDPTIFGTNSVLLDWELNSALQQYWVNIDEYHANNTFWTNHQDHPWSAVYISYMMGYIDLSAKLSPTAQQSEDQGYGSKKWKKSASHYGYATHGLNIRKQGGKGGNWVAFALRDIAAEELGELQGISVMPSQPYDIPIKAQQGDVLIRPRDGKPTDSHGVIVSKVSNGKIEVAHGNTSNDGSNRGITNIVEEYAGMIDSNGNYVVENSKGFLIVLKRFE